MTGPGLRQHWAQATHLPQGFIYPELVHGAMVETLVQNTAAFNADSRNTIRLVDNRRLGDFAQETFFKNTPNLIQDRDVDTVTSPIPDANSAVTPTNVPMDEHISVKVNKRIGPIDHTLDSFRKLGNNPDFEVLSMLLGEQIGKAAQIDYLNAALTSVVAAILAQATLVLDKGPTPGGSPNAGENLQTKHLVSTLALMGDAASRVEMWIMHSKPYFDLVQNQINLNIDGVSNFNVQTATPITLNRPVLVTDDASLVTSGVGSPESTEYITLGLQSDAVVLENSEDETMVTELITGRQNIVTRLQGEYAYNVSVKGAKWDVTNGGVNPSLATLGTGTNWDIVMDDVKDFAGVALRTR